MNNNSKPRPDNNRQFFLRYAALGTQIMAALVIAVFAGLKLDKWLHTSPLLAAALPLLILAGMFYKLFRETSRKNRNE